LQPVSKSGHRLEHRRCGLPYPFQVLRSELRLPCCQWICNQLISERHVHTHKVLDRRHMFSCQAIATHSNQARQLNCLLQPSLCFYKQKANSVVRCCPTLSNDSCACPDQCRKSYLLCVFAKACRSSCPICQCRLRSYESGHARPKRSRNALLELWHGAERRWLPQCLKNGFQSLYQGQYPHQLAILLCFSLAGHHWRRSGAEPQ